MPDLPSRPSLSQIRKQAKSLRKSCSDADPEALKRFRDHHPDVVARTSISLRDAQLVVAREYGYNSWADLKTKVESEAGKEDHKTILARRIREQTSEDGEIDRIIHEATGSRAAQKTRLTKHLSSEVYHVVTGDGQEVSYRANWYSSEGGSHYVIEKQALDELESRGIPAPRNLYIEHGLPGYKWRSVIVNTWIKGSTLGDLIGTIGDDEYERLLRQVGQLIGRIHGIRGDAFIRHTWPGGPVRDPDWRSCYWNSIDHDRLGRSAQNVGLSTELVDEGLRLLEEGLDLGNDVQPVLEQGDFSLEHIIVCDGEVRGLVDFEYARYGDPADGAFWDDSGGWWDAFTGEKKTEMPAAPLNDGYRVTATLDEAFERRARWLRFRGGMGGLEYHGVNDVNTTGMMDFLNWRYREDLEVARACLV